MSLGREIKEAIGAFGAISAIDNQRRRTEAYEEIARNKSNNGAPSASQQDAEYQRKYGALPPGVKPLGKPPGIVDRIRGVFGGSPRGGGNSGNGDGVLYQMPLDPNSGSVPTDEYPPPDDTQVEGAQDGGVVMGYQDGGAAVRARQQQWANANTSAVQARGAPPEVVYPGPGPGDPPEVVYPAPGPGDPPEVEYPNPAAQTVAPGAPPTVPPDRGPRAEVPSPGYPVSPDRARTAPYEGVPRFEGAEPPDRSGGAVPDRAGAGKAVAPKGNSKRKALRDQSRTEAYDPVLDKDDPDNMIRLAINGAMDYANDTFELNRGKIDAIGTEDPRTVKGRKAFVQGVGAAPQEDIDQLNKIAAETAPDKKLLASDPNVRDSIVALRRLNIVYEHFVQTGQTDKANKAAFEIIQYSAGKSAEYGAQAQQALAAGDTENAKRLVARAYSQVPDGNHMVISPDGRFAIIRGDDGKPVDKYEITPKNLLQAALGLSNKSMFWEILHNRANMVGRKPGKDTTELDKARIENLNARTAAVKAKLGGGGKAAPAAATPSPVAGLVSDLQSKTGTVVPNPNPGGEGSQPASPQTSEAAPADGGDPDADASNDGAGAATSAAANDGVDVATSAGADVRAMEGPNEVGQGDANLPLPPASVLRTNKPSPAQASAPVQPPTAEAPAAAPGRTVPSGLGPRATAVTPAGTPAAAAPAKFDAKGKDYDYESAKAAGLQADETGHWPSRDPKSGLLLKGAGHETWQKTLDAERKAGYQIFEGKDGRYYSIMDNTVVPNDVIHDGKRTNAPVFQPPKYDVAHPGAKLEGTKFAGANPYSKVLQDEGFRQWVAANTKNKAGPQELARVQNMEREYNNQIKAWETGRKAFEKEHRDAFNKEQALNVAEAKRVYDRTLTTRELQELPAQINEYVKPIAEGKGPDGKVRPSIWNAPPEVVQSEELKSLATNLFTSNKNMPTDMAVRLVHALTVPGTEPNERQFQPRGYDRAGNIVVNPKIERKDPKTGKIVSEVDDSVEFHIRPGAFKQINRITERYRTHMLKEQAKPPEKTWGDVVQPLVDYGASIPARIEDGRFSKDILASAGAMYSWPGRAIGGIDKWSARGKAAHQAKEPTGAVDAIRNRTLQPNRYYNP